METPTPAPTDTTPDPVTTDPAVSSTVPITEPPAIPTDTAQPAETPENTDTPPQVPESTDSPQEDPEVDFTFYQAYSADLVDNNELPEDFNTEEATPDSIREAWRNHNFGNIAQELSLIHI